MATAIECFAQKGFYGTTTHEIADRVGISQPYLYRLYATKQALFAAAVDHVSVVMTETLTCAEQQKADRSEPSSLRPAQSDQFPRVANRRNLLACGYERFCWEGFPPGSRSFPFCLFTEVVPSGVWSAADLRTVRRTPCVVSRPVLAIPPGESRSGRVPRSRWPPRRERAGERRRRVR
ncbi:TetR/AcrR family transcriptional regulator [Streptomyces sp. NPDC127033]|uniref:TetR/AcrR family transcriptional regulator n=1 Tax=Streptomyces sp. NPDC127033 TaxID=3347110 RepID=UPI00364DF90B